MDLLPEVQAYIQHHRLLDVGQKVVVGVSGGPDSVTLLDLLHRLARTWDLDLHVAHLHHGIRGTEADRDAEFVTALAKERDLPFTVKRVDLPSIAEKEGLAIEEAARRVRYAFLAQTAQQLGAGVIAVGHHADDQAETVLMHLLRGAGLAGLRGMLPETLFSDYRLLLFSPFEEAPEGTVPPLCLIRPLLGVERERIDAYCEARELRYRFDRSNLDTTYFRNRLRHEVLPYLADINPRISQRLCHLAEVVRADYAVLEGEIAEAWNNLIVTEHADAIAFDLEGWRNQPLAIQRALIRRAAFELRRTLRDVGFIHVEDAVQVGQRGTTGAEATLPRDLVVRVGYTTLTVADTEALHLPPERPWLEPGAEIPIAVPGRTQLPGGWILEAEVLDTWNMATLTTNPHPMTAWMNVDCLEGTPVLRTRQKGDRFRPHGMEGAEVQLSDFLINVKLPLAWRDHLPLLVSGGEILWVVGLRMSEEALVYPETLEVVRMRFLKSGGPKENEV
ncbi:MAG: tRNA lysidine(34) synthetase TilS [Anaerolineae bacterium]